MNGRKGSWWGWLVAVFVVFTLFGDGDVPVLPLLVGFFILANVLGGRRAVGRRQDRRSRGRTAATPDPQNNPLPRIDVPRYPGTPSPPTGQPYGPPAADPSAPPVVQPSAAQDEPAPHSSTDPVVSLGQLHLARCGRDLQAAARHGTAADVARVLDETRDLSRRMQDMLDAAEGTPGSGRREFRAGLRAVDRLVEEARGEHPPGARLTRVTQACLRMGHTGRHE